MTTIVRNITFDCADPYQLARFWSAVVDRPIYPGNQPGDHEVGIDLPGGQSLIFQAVPEPKTVKNRIHVCLQADTPREVEVERVLGLGATMAADRRNPDGTGWAVLADPEGNEFCVLRSVAERGF
jgi:hypothetical protein